MAILPIYVAPHPVLKKKAEPAESVTDELRKLMDDMLETMYAADGIGLAAPQVGASQRVVVMDINQPKDASDLPPEQRRGKPRFFVNPEVVWSAPDLRIYNEGCLSVPGQYAEVTRPDKVRVRFLDYDGKQQEIEAEGLLATCIQHEIDHLDGVLFVDHLSTLKRDMVMRKLKKFVKEYEEDMQKTHVL